MANSNPRKNFWRQQETADAAAAPAELLAHLRFDRNGLIPVVTQCVRTQRVLMLAWMNAAAIKRTLREGRMVYYSRSRRCLWRKGDISGNTQQLRSLSADCDGDSLLAQVEQTGGACHTGRDHCFFHPLTTDATGADATDKTGSDNNA